MLLERHKKSFFTGTVEPEATKNWNLMTNPPFFSFCEAKK
jgi:hypothetical protein